MGRHAKNSLDLGDGRRVGYSPKTRGGLFRVRFRHPTDPNKYVEASTGIAVPKGWSSKKNPPADWFPEAERAVRAAYAPAGGGAGGAGPATWAEAEAEILAVYPRQGSRRTFLSAMSQVKNFLPNSVGPAGVTRPLAEEFARWYAAGGYRRSESADGTVRPRSAQTVDSTLRNLSVIWRKLAKSRLVVDNFWPEVTRPRVPRKLPRVPTEESFDFFYAWLDIRFPGPYSQGWELIRTFVQVKACAGCRLADLCQARSSQFDAAAGTLRIDAAHDKTHRERVIHLDPRLVDTLNRLKGATYLWERYAVDSLTYRPGRRRASQFKPSLIYFAVTSIFREFGLAHPEHKIKTHDFRKRAITMTVMAMEGDLEATAQAIPVTSETARKHYLDTRRAYDAAAIQKKTAPSLLGGSMRGGPT